MYFRWFKSDSWIAYKPPILLSEKVDIKVIELHDFIEGPTPEDSNHYIILHNILYAMMYCAGYDAIEEQHDTRNVEQPEHECRPVPRQGKQPGDLDCQRLQLREWSHMLTRFFVFLSEVIVISKRCFHKLTNQFLHAPSIQICRLTSILPHFSKLHPCAGDLI